jgi:hypothetical protein
MRLKVAAANSTTEAGKIVSFNIRAGIIRNVHLNHNFSGAAAGHNLVLWSLNFRSITAVENLGGLRQRTQPHNLIIQVYGEVLKISILC